MRGFLRTGGKRRRGAAQSWAFCKGRFGPLGRPGAVQQPARFPHGVGAVVFQAAGCLFNPAAARSGERNHGFAGKVLAFQKGIHNAGFHIPPDRKTQQHGIILRQVHSRRRQGRAAGRVAHFPGTAALAVAPVQVGRGIGGRRADFIQVCPDGLRHLPRYAGGHAAGRKIGNQNFVLHQKALLPQKFYAHGSANRAAVQRKYKLTLCQRLHCTTMLTLCQQFRQEAGTAGCMHFFCPPAQTQTIL